MGNKFMWDRGRFANDSTIPLLEPVMEDSFTMLLISIDHLLCFGQRKYTNLTSGKINSNNASWEWTMREFLHLEVSDSTYSLLTNSGAVRWLSFCLLQRPNRDCIWRVHRWWGKKRSKKHRRQDKRENVKLITRGQLGSFLITLLPKTSLQIQSRVSESELRLHLEVWTVA